MELDLLSPTTLTQALNAPSGTFVLAAMLASGDPRFSDACEIDGMTYPTVMAGGWTITTRDGASHPDTFGLDTYCNSARRCVGCSNGCSTEKHLLELSRRTGGAPVLWLEAGHGIDRLPWLQLQVWMPASPHLSGNWTPIWNEAKMRLELVSSDTMMTAIIEAGGSLAIKRSTKPPRGLREDIARMFDRWTLLVDQQERLNARLRAAPARSFDQAPVVGAN